MLNDFSLNLAVFLVFSTTPRGLTGGDLVRLSEPNLLCAQIGNICITELRLQTQQTMKTEYRNRALPSSIKLRFD